MITNINPFLVHATAAVPKRMESLSSAHLALRRVLGSIPSEMTPLG